MSVKKLILMTFACSGLALGIVGCGGEPARDEQRTDLPFLAGKGDAPSWLKHIPANWGCDQTLLGAFAGFDSAHLYSFPGKVGYSYTFSFEATYPWHKGAVIAVYDAESGRRVALAAAWDNSVSLQYVAEANVKYLVAVYSIYLRATGRYTLSAACELVGCQSNAECAAGSYCRFESGCGQFEKGACQTIPEICYEVYAPVCGCNGTTYSNDCDAAAYGVSVDHPGACEPQQNDCQAAGGYCGHFLDTCNAGYQAGPPLGCPMGKSGMCCQPLAKIELDRPGFKAFEAIDAKVVNMAATETMSEQSIFLAGCSVFSWQKEVNGTWQDMGPERVCVWEGYGIEVEAGEAYEELLAARDAGTWRLVSELSVDCTPGLPLSQASCAASVVITSEAFKVKNCPMLSMPDPLTFCPDGDIVPKLDADGICVAGFDCLPKCRQTGCSSQLCADQEMISTCEFLPWYTCYDFSACGRYGENNTCAWQQTEEHLACLAQFGK